MSRGTCYYCGEDLDFIECPECGGQGFTGEHDCGEDTCACADPQPNVDCDICHGDGGWYEAHEHREAARPSDGGGR